MRILDHRTMNNLRLKDLCLGEWFMLNGNLYLVMDGKTDLPFTGITRKVICMNNLEEQKLDDETIIERVHVDLEVVD